MEQLSTQIQITTAEAENMEEDKYFSMTTYDNLLYETGLSQTSDLSRIFFTTAENINENDDVIEVANEMIFATTFGLFILTFIGVTGNLMTITAFAESRKHNEVYDFFILNLAITDLIICCICMPFHTAYIVKEFTWPFGNWLCKVWLITEFTACTETTLLMLILSLDRLLMISLGPLYKQKVTWKVAKSMLVISWIISIVQYSPAIVIWEYFSENSTVAYMDCNVEFADDIVFTNIMVIFEFVIPFVSLAIINGILFYKIKSWVTKRRQVYKDQSVIVSKERSQLSEDKMVNKTAANIGCGSDVKAVPTVTGITDNLNRPSQQKSQQKTVPSSASSSTTSKAKSKSAKFLATLVLVFFICWLPYEISTVISSVCYDCVNWVVFEYLILLLLIKSVVNPFLYAFNSPRYRKCFKRYITLNGKLWKTKSIN